MYLLAGAEVFTLGLDTLVVVDIVLPAVLGPGSADVRGCARDILDGVAYWFCWGKRASKPAIAIGKC